MILVTGGTGLTGHFVVEELLGRGQPARVLARPESAARARAAGVEVAIGDLADPDSLRRAAGGVTGIVHAACTLTDSAIDIAAMRALLGSWQTGPFIFISTLDVYGFTQSVPVTEDSPLSETYGDYGLGKVVCERLLADAAAAAGRSDYAMLRAPYIWGPHSTARKRLVKECLQNDQPIVLPGSSEDEWSQYQDAWIDVRDMASIVAKCLARPPGGPLNVLAGHFIWHDLFAELIRLTGSRSQIVHKPLDAIGDDELPRKQLYAQKWHFSNTRLDQHAGSICRHSFHATLRDTVMHPG